MLTNKFTDVNSKILEINTTVLKFFAAATGTSFIATYFPHGFQSGCHISRVRRLSIREFWFNLFVDV